MSKCAAAVAAVVLVSLCCTAGASADSAVCGASTATACPVTAGTQGETLTGTIAPGATDVWYVFYATKNTRLNTTLTDDEDPGCSSAQAVTVSCGSVTDDLYNARGLAIGGAPGQSQPSDMMAVAISYAVPIPASGTYYLLVSGSPTQDSTGGQETTPFTLVVSASAAIQWPPPPMCTVPTLRGATLSNAEKALRGAHCTVGRVRRVYSSVLKSGLLLSSSASRGSKHPADFAVAITVSRGSRPKPKRR